MISDVEALLLQNFQSATQRCG
uniref:Uncharacterized protein n=1 Tax=Arundo donax TaxID=35708 RepID=A0A0A9A0E0_ARUDO